MNRQQNRKIIAITEFDRTVVEDEKFRIAHVREILKKYSQHESLEFLQEVETDQAVAAMSRMNNELQQSRRSERGSESSGKWIKKTKITTKKLYRQKYNLKPGSGMSIWERYALSLRYLLILIFLGSLAGIRFYFMSSATREPIFLFRTFQTAKDMYMGFIGIHTSMSALMLYSPGDTIKYEHPLKFFEEMQNQLTQVWVPALLKLAADNADLTTGKLLNTLLYDVQFCDMLQLTAENNTLYSNCESALGGTTQNTMARFILQYPKLIDQYVSRWSLETTQMGKDMLLKAEEFASLLSFSAYNQFGTNDAIYYHFQLPLSVQLSTYIVRALLVVDLTNIITGALGLLIAVCSIGSIYTSSRKKFSEAPQMISSVPIRLLLSNPQFRLMVKNIQAKGTFLGIWT